MKNIRTKRLLLVLITFAIFAVLMLSMGFISMRAMALDKPHEHDGITFYEWENSTSLPSSAGNYVLMTDVVISSSWEVPNGTVNLCLNGHGIKFSSYASIDISSNSILNIYDCDETTKHKFTVTNVVDNGAGVAQIDDNLTGTEGTDYLTFTGGYITGANTSWSGGCIYLEGTLNLYGGNLIGNSVDQDGGTVYMQGNSRFNMYGGSMQYNYGRTGSTVFVESGTIFTMEGGLIAHNRSGVRSGAIFDRGQVYIKGGEISENYNTYEKANITLWGGAIEITGGTIKDNLSVVNHMSGIEFTNISLGGNPVITGNVDTNGNVANLYMYNGGCINIVSALEDTVKNNKIGVTMQSETGVLTNGWSKFMGDKDPSDYFFDESGNYDVYLYNGEAYIGICPHEHNNVSFVKWEDSTSLPTTAGDYFLATNVTLASGTWTVPTGTTNLCLNGYGIIGNTGNAVITIGSGATLYLHDCGETVHKYTVDANHLATVNDNLTGTEGVDYFTFTGGYVTGAKRTNQGSSGGGVYANLGTFVLNGGTIIGNSADMGGGVRATGTFIMNGGAIRNNNAVTSNGRGQRNGGGLYINGTMTMNGGIITENWCANAGGGVLLQSTASSFIMNGGSIVNNYNRGLGNNMPQKNVQIGTDAIIEGNVDQDGNPCDIWLLQAGNKIELLGVRNNTTPIAVYMGTPGVFTTGLSGKGTISQFTSNVDTYFVKLDSSGEAQLAEKVASVTKDGTTTYYDDINQAFETWKSGGTLKLWKNASKSAINIRPTNGYNAKEYTIDLNGKTLNLENFQVGMNSSPNTYRSGPTLTFEDSATGGKVIFTGSSMVDYGGLLVLKGGAFTGGRGTWGGFILLHIYGSMDMYDGVTITGNSATYGSGVFVGSDSVFNMYGGIITGNTASDSGGGVILSDNNAAVFNMYGGEISGNSAPKGGGVCVSTGVFNVCGNDVIIKDNVYGSSPNNVYLNTGRVIAIQSELTTAQIGVKLAGGEGVFTSGWNTYMSKKECSDYFSMDETGYKFDLSNGEVCISHVHTWGYSVNGNVITATCSGKGTCDVGTQTLTISAQGKDYDGTAVTATITKGTGWTEDNGLTLPGDISYTGNTNAGTYTASVSVGTYTASVEFTINPLVMTVSASTFEGDYDGEEHSITVNVTDPTDATIKYGTKDGEYNLSNNPVYTEAGTYTVYYKIEKANYVTVTGSKTITINKINATVTIVGNNSIVFYDGLAHTVSDYVATVNTDLFDVDKDIEFTGNATIYGTNAGTTYMSLATTQFRNTNNNFDTVTFVITDGYLTINPIDVTVAITGHNSTLDYDGEKHTVTGYDAVPLNDLYDVTKDFTFSGNASVERTDAGTTEMGLDASQFTNINSNFAIVTFVVTDGYQTVLPIDVTVVITGHNDKLDYDSENHTVTGYDAVSKNKLYDVTKDYTFSGNASVERTNAGTTEMGLNASQFKNINPNFATVTFEITDGYLTVNQITAIVTIIGNEDTLEYNGSEQEVTGYVVGTNTDLYDIAKDFVFTGNARAASTDVGEYDMNLEVSQFANVSPNFRDVTFMIVDGSLTITKVEASFINPPVSAEPEFDGEEHELVVVGETESGTVLYALGTDETTVPDDKKFSETVPVAIELGSYYVWYKIQADDNHYDLLPACVVATITGEDLSNLKGILYDSDGKTPLAGVTVKLVSGSETIATTTTNSEGKYRFDVLSGVYNIVAEFDDKTETALVSVLEDVEQNFVMNSDKTESVLKVESENKDYSGIAVGGLNKEAQKVRETENVSSDKKVSILMKVEYVSEETSSSSTSISDTAKDKKFDFFEIIIEKTIDSVTTVMDTTSNVLEIAIPYAHADKQDLVVYSYHGSEVVKYNESDSKEAGTFRVDKENGIVYVYANSFSTFAIGYTPYYKVSGKLTFAPYTGKVTVVLENKDTGKTYTLENVNMSDVSFTDVPKGEYTLMITWKDVAENKLTMSIKINGATNTNSAPDKAVMVTPESKDNFTTANTISYLVPISKLRIKGGI